MSSSKWSQEKKFELVLRGTNYPLPPKGEEGFIILPYLCRQSFKGFSFRSNPPLP